jgi:hypothetical protein
MGKKRVDADEELKDASLDADADADADKNQDDIVHLDAPTLKAVENSETLDDDLKIVEASLPKVQVVESGRLWRLIGGSHSFHCPQTGKFVTIRKGDLVRIEADTYDELPPWAKGKVQVAVVV